MSDTSAPRWSLPVHARFLHCISAIVQLSYVYKKEVTDISTSKTDVYYTCLAGCERTDKAARNLAEKAFKGSTNAAGHCYICQKFLERCPVLFMIVRLLWTKDEKFRERKLEECQWTDKELVEEAAVLVELFGVDEETWKTQLSSALDLLQAWTTDTSGTFPSSAFNEVFGTAKLPTSFSSKATGSLNLIGVRRVLAKNSTITILRGDLNKLQRESSTTPTSTTGIVSRSDSSTSSSISSFQSGSDSSVADEESDPDPMDVSERTSESDHFTGDQGRIVVDETRKILIKTAFFTLCGESDDVIEEMARQIDAQQIQRLIKVLQKSALTGGRDSLLSDLATPQLGPASYPDMSSVGDPFFGFVSDESFNKADSSPSTSSTVAFAAPAFPFDSVVRPPATRDFDNLEFVLENSQHELAFAKRALAESQHKLVFAGRALAESQHKLALAERASAEEFSSLATPRARSTFTSSGIVLRGLAETLLSFVTSPIYSSLTFLMGRTPLASPSNYSPLPSSSETTKQGDLGKDTAELISQTLKDADGISVAVQLVDQKIT